MLLLLLLLLLFFCFWLCISGPDCRVWMMGIINSSPFSVPKSLYSSPRVDCISPHLGLTLDSTILLFWPMGVEVVLCVCGDGEPVWSLEGTRLHPLLLALWHLIPWKEHAVASLLLQGTGEIQGAYSDLWPTGWQRDTSLNLNIPVGALESHEGNKGLLMYVN